MKLETISSQRLSDLESAMRKLNALEAGGVDNWEWYDESMKVIRAEDELSDKLSDIWESITDLISESAYEPSGRGAGFTFDDNEAMKFFMKSVTEIINDKV